MKGSEIFSLNAYDWQNPGSTGRTLDSVYKEALILVKGLLIREYFGPSREIRLPEGDA